MEKLIIVIGILLTGFLTLPLMFVSLIVLVNDYYELHRNGEPPTKDEWKEL